MQNSGSMSAKLEATQNLSTQLHCNSGPLYSLSTGHVICATSPVRDSATRPPLRSAKPEQISTGSWTGPSSFDWQPCNEHVPKAATDTSSSAAGVVAREASAGAPGL